MYSKELIESVQKYKKRYPKTSNLQISKIFGISVGSVKNWLSTKFNINNRSKLCTEEFFDDFLKNVENDKEYNDAYFYILGQYLGDGYINEMPNKRAFRLCISEANSYPGIKEETIRALNIIFPSNKVSKMPRQGCENIILYNKELPKIFPHCGPGKKHERKIQLSDWQRNNINYKFLLKGLFHADGCYYEDSRSWTTHDGVLKQKIYTFYNFVNCSEDLIQLFCEGLDNFKIEYCVRNKCKQKENHAPAKLVEVRKTEYVNKLRELIGIKY